MKGVNWPLNREGKLSKTIHIGLGKVGRKKESNLQ